jgi:hypothetical protein
MCDTSVSTRRGVRGMKGKGMRKETKKPKKKAK